VDTAVVLPGSGSDEVFVRSAFARPLALVGVRLVAQPPRPGPELVRHQLTALDAAARRHGRVLAGGVSLGAHLAAEWAAANPRACAGLLLALPGWTGAPGHAPAAVAALASAESVRRDGLGQALETATSGVAGWLADELRRAWPRYGDGLADSLQAGASHPAPDQATLRGITAAAGVVACSDDPVHPAAVAAAWASALPSAALLRTTLDVLGEDREALGRAAVLAWLRARAGRR
jgi:pimeloyl-ACP methyl ester carboxylesterase